MPFLQFVPAENAKMKKVVTVMRAAKIFKEMGAKRARERHFEWVEQHQNELTLKNPGTVYGYAKTWGDDEHGVLNFCQKVSGGEDIVQIPFMTEGLAYVLKQMDIRTVSQLIAKFIESNNGYREATNMCFLFQKWLDKVTRNTVASEVDTNMITKVIAQYADERGLLSEDSDQRLFEERFFRR